MTRRAGKTLRMEGFQKPSTPATTIPVGLALVRVEAGLVTCNCGWHFYHPRTKVLEDRAQSHVDRKHGGAAAWI